MIEDNLTVLVRRLRRYADDPMWDSHAEVPKILLLETIEALSDRPRAAEIGGKQATK